MEKCFSSSTLLVAPINFTMSDEKQTHDPEAVQELPSPVDGKNGVSEKILQHSNDADDAMKAFAAVGEVIELDEETNKRLLRKIDWNIMPLLCVVYMLNFLDKTCISYASVMGLKKDLGLHGQQYSWLGSALAVRFFLGLFEAAVTPGFALFTSQWYTAKEQGLRTGIWFSFNGWAQILGGLVAYGIARGTDAHEASIEPWKIVFLVTGLLTVVVGILFYFFMPDNQLNARFLTPDERLLAVERVRINQQGIGNKHFKMYQVKEALTDPLAWMFFFYALIADLPNGGLTNFFSLLIESFGYTAEQSLLYGTPAGAVEVVSLIACGWLGDRVGSRLLVSTSCLWLSILGVLLIVCLPDTMNVGKLIGYYLTGSAATCFVALLSLISSNVAGYTKKTTVAAMYLIGYCVGNIIGPQTFQAKDAPKYVPAEVTIIVCWGIAALLVYAIYFYCRYQNKLKAHIRSQPGYVKLENQEFLDLTDKENPEFIYTL
ncbi:putative MFS allantoate transporter [Aureobasidium pullulans]|uniref:Putative MFS allantoate transporter n=1 Tax=Aureobasidium pullulans TaxID=5580 RepID=A0A4S9B2Y7_AURPU|nr:putative MFS allantoate transporter [Aureobasidium pullulans]